MWRTPIADAYAPDARFTTASYELRLATWLTCVLRRVRAGLLTHCGPDRLGGLAAGRSASHRTGRVPYNSWWGSLSPLYGRVGLPPSAQPRSEGDPSRHLHFRLNSRQHQSLSAQLAALHSTILPHVDALNAINSWNFTHDGVGLPMSVPRIIAAQWRSTRTRSVGGAITTPTPFFADRESPPGSRLTQHPIRSTNGGHMTYLKRRHSRVSEKADVRSFYHKRFARSRDE